MAYYEPREYTDMIGMYGLSGYVAGRATELYAERFPNRTHPDGRTIVRAYQRSCETGK